MQGVVFKSGADITMDNIADKVIGVQSGTTGQIESVDRYGEDHVLAYDKYSLAFQALQNGQVDCIMVDDMVGAAYVKQIAGLEMISSGFDAEEFAFGFAKGNAELLDAFNAELQKLIDDGTIEAIILKWNEYYRRLTVHTRRKEKAEMPFPFCVLTEGEDNFPWSSLLPGKP